MADTFQMADQFKGLPMGDLIGGPLQAACDAQVRLALATANFIQQIGFMPDEASATNDVNATREATKIRTVSFKFDRPSRDQTPGTAQGDPAVTRMETVELTVPLLAIVKVPALSINTVDITFDMEVKNTERSTQSVDAAAKMTADASVGWGPFSLKVHVEGSVATHKENTRETDQSAKYHVEVHAEDKGMPEGLSRVLDMMMQAIAPSKVTPAQIAAQPAAAQTADAADPQASATGSGGDAADPSPGGDPAAPGPVNRTTVSRAPMGGGADGDEIPLVVHGRGEE